MITRERIEELQELLTPSHWRSFEEDGAPAYAMVPTSDLRRLLDLAQRVAEAEHDAARYRYIRRKEARKYHNHKLPGSISAVYVSNFDGYADALDTEELDAAVDAAIARLPLDPPRSQENNNEA